MVRHSHSRAMCRVGGDVTTPVSRCKIHNRASGVHLRQLLLLRLTLLNPAQTFRFPHISASTHCSSPIPHPLTPSSPSLFAPPAPAPAPAPAGASTTISFRTSLTSSCIASRPAPPEWCLRCAEAEPICTGPADAPTVCPKGQTQNSARMSSHR